MLLLKKSAINSVCLLMVENGHYKPVIIIVSLLVVISSSSITQYKIVGCPIIQLSPYTSLLTDFIHAFTDSESQASF